MPGEADIIGALVTLLKADAGVTAAAGEHVYGVELPANATKDMPLDAILIQPSGGVSLTAGSDAAVESQRFDLFGYGATPFAADRMRRLGAAAVRSARRVTIDVGGHRVLIHWVNKAGGFFAARERDGLWPQSFQSFQVFFATQEVAA